MSFFGPFWGGYWVIDLKNEYSRSIVGELSGRYLWILSRTPTISDKERADALARIEALGYDAAAHYFPKQPPSPDNPRPE